METMQEKYYVFGIDSKDVEDLERIKFALETFHCGEFSEHFVFSIEGPDTIGDFNLFAEFRECVQYDNPYYNPSVIVGKMRAFAEGYFACIVDLP